MRHYVIAHKHRSKQAFTTIELLVVIGVIAILVGLVFAAMRGTLSATKVKATRGTLGNLQGMLAELEAANGLQRHPATWLWTEDQLTVIPVPSSTVTISYDFWAGPTILAVGTTPATYDPLPSPGQVSETVPNQRNGSIATVNTSLAMSMIAAFPANRSRLQALPQQQQFVPTWVNGRITLPGPDRFDRTTDDHQADLQFIPGMHVQFNGHFFIASQSYTAGGSAPVNGNTPQTAPNAPWWDETAAPFHAPIILDAWGNPIIYVPRSGLRVRMLNGATSYDPTNTAQNWIVLSPEGSTVNPTTGQPTNGTGAPQVFKAGRPFFASAGPDGDFSTGDDNIYSFEK